MMPLNVAGIPAALRAERRWVLWRYEQRPGHAEPTKVPYCGSDPSRHASSIDPTTWASFEQAVAALPQADGIGFCLGDGFAGVDLDDVRDPMTGALTDKAQRIVAELNSYTEVSPSGTGIHVLVWGALPPNGRRGTLPDGTGVELYDNAQFFCVTGQHLDGTPTTMAERTAQLATLHAELFPPPAPAAQPVRRRGVEPDDHALLARARHAKHGAAFTRLYDQGAWQGDYASQSEADLALCSALAFWTNSDRTRVDALFRASGLMRPKWDTRRGDTTYGAITISKATTTTLPGRAGSHAEGHKEGATMDTSKTRITLRPSEANDSSSGITPGSDAQRASTRATRATRLLDSQTPRATRLPDSQTPSVDTACKSTRLIALVEPPRDGPSGRTPDLRDQLVSCASTLARRVEGIAPHKATFKLAQALRGIPGADAAFATDPDTVRPAVEAFCAAAGPPHDDPEAVHLALAVAWDKVRDPGGVLAHAVELARAHPITLTGSLARFGATTRFVLSIVYHLARRGGEAEVILPQEAIADAARVSQPLVSDIFALARKEGFLRQTAKASYAKRRAAEYAVNLQAACIVAPDGLHAVDDGVDHRAALEVLARERNWPGCNLDDGPTIGPGEEDWLAFLATASATDLARAGRALEGHACPAS